MASSFERHSYHGRALVNCATKVLKHTPSTSGQNFLNSDAPCTLSPRSNANWWLKTRTGMKILQEEYMCLAGASEGRYRMYFAALQASPRTQRTDVVQHPRMPMRRFPTSLALLQKYRRNRSSSAYLCNCPATKSASLPRSGHNCWNEMASLHHPFLFLV